MKILSFDKDSMLAVVDNEHELEMDAGDSNNVIIRLSCLEGCCHEFIRSLNAGFH
jgi:hypothetical protein